MAAKLLFDSLRASFVKQPQLHVDKWTSLTTSNSVKDIAVRDSICAVLPWLILRVNMSSGLLMPQFLWGKYIQLESTGSSGNVC